MNSFNSYRWKTVSAVAGLTIAMAAASCGPVSPRDGFPEAANTVLPQSVTDPSGKPVTGGGQGISAMAPGDFAALQGTYTGSLYYYYDTQNYTLNVSQKAYNGVTYPYVTFQSSGVLGSFAFGGYLQVTPYPVTLVQGSNYYLLTSNIIPADLVAPWVNSEISMGLLLGVKNVGGSKKFDPTQSLIYIMDCAFSVGVNSCSNVYDSYIAGFLNDFGKH